MEKNTYTYDEAFKASCEYFKGDELAARVWVNKYALKDSFGNIYEKTPDDMHRRIAKEIVRIEEKYNNPMTEEQVFDLIRDFKYIVPQGSPMAGIGNNYQIGSLSNCFVIGLDGSPDSYGGIIKIDEDETPWRSGARLVAHPSERVACQEFRVDLYRLGAFYGALLQLHARGSAGRPPRRVDAVGEHQASRQRIVYRREDDGGQGDWRKRVGAY